MMRNNHKGAPEIISAFERDEQFFGIVSISLAGVKKKYEFDIDQDSYLAIKRLINMKPFGRKRGLRYHYYFSPGAERSDDSARTYCQVWIEQEDSGKEFEIEAPEALIAKLNWFFRVKGLKELSRLRRFQ
jgi:hypothetical protein